MNLAERQQGTTSAVQLKLRGMRLAASKHKEELAIAQQMAKYIAYNMKVVTIEDVRNSCDYKPWTLGNAAGSVFDGDDWECVGYTTAKRPEAHGRVIRQWRLKK
jgi:hypothetical protein